MIRSKIKTEDPTKIDNFLGCQHTIVEKFIKDGENPFVGVGSNPSQVKDATDKHQATRRVKVRAMVYDMSWFLGSCVDKYLELANTTKDKLKKAATPFLDDTKTKRTSDE